MRIFWICDPVHLRVHFSFVFLVIISKTKHQVCLGYCYLLSSQLRSAPWLILKQVSGLLLVERNCVNIGSVI